MKTICVICDLTNLTDLRSFMGLVNQLMELSQTSQPQLLCPLMGSRSFFTWIPDKAFTCIKAALMSPPILASFYLALQIDASLLYGIGYAPLQDQGRMCLVQCSSCFLKDAKTRYATIELEMLTVAWTMSKLKLYLFGLPNFILMTNHHPLIPILNSYTLDAVENPHLQRLKKISFIFIVVWKAGKHYCIPNVLSRAPVSRPTPEDKRDDCTYKVNHCHHSPQNLTLSGLFRSSDM